MNKFKFIFLTLLLINCNLLANINKDKIEESNKILFEENIKKNIELLLKNDYKPLLISKKNLKEYYKINNYKAFWIDENGLKDIFLVLLEKIKNDPVLKPYTNKIFKLDTVVENLKTLDSSTEKYIQSMLKIDFMLTEIYDKYISYVSKGSIDWNLFQKKLIEQKETDEIKAYWDKYSQKHNPKYLLKNAIEQNNLESIFKEVDFNYPHFDKLISAIDELEIILQQGGYTQIPYFKVLKEGDKSEAVKSLRKRLIESKDLTSNCIDTVNMENIVTNNIKIDNKSNILENKQEEPSCETYFDEELKNAVISFQKNHGLYADGIVGNTTRKYLNIPADKKINQIRLNLERMRWLPRELGNKYLLVNIPEYKMRMIDNSKIKLDMEVIVGEKKHPTPIFSDKMSYIVLNPNWNIPESITKKEILPKLIEDPNYLKKKGINIYEDWNHNSAKMNTSEVINAFGLEDIKSFPNLRFTQEPSNSNPLGKMKFMFPNKHSVYIHDTPAKNLFKNTNRAYSHGCIRLSKPEELLSTIANEDKNVNIEKVNKILKEKEEESIGLTNKIPIHIVYLTSWVDESGKLQFREDIYNYDKMQSELMF